MKKVEQALTTKLLKKLDDVVPFPIWVEVKAVERPHRFSTRLLSDKAKMLLQFSKLKHKFSDASGLGTPLDFIYLPKVETLLCVIFYKKHEKSRAYFMKYEHRDENYLLTEDECRERALFLTEL